MTDTTQRAVLGAALGAALGAPVRSLTPVAGGDIAQAYRARTESRSYFVKALGAARADVLAAEADGLAALAVHAGPAGLRVPAVVALGEAGPRAWLALEWLDFAARDAKAERRLGAGLATLHGATLGAFGHARDNYIGTTLQANAPLADGVEFLRLRRLKPMLLRAAARGAPTRLIDEGERLLGVVPAFYRSYQPRPAPLHGDLWSGNWGALGDGAPVLYDPAFHAGDREADLAMADLFGGFGREFRAAYAHVLAPDAGYPVRRDLHQLYHVLNHFVLFGGGYAVQAEQLVGRLLAAAR